LVEVEGVVLLVVLVVIMVCGVTLAAADGGEWWKISVRIRKRMNRKKKPANEDVCRLVVVSTHLCPRHGMWEPKYSIVVKFLKRKARKKLT
jgi:hypothetical protein